MKEEKVYIGLHIPKTGGQTLRIHLAKYYKLHSEFIHLGGFGIENAKKKGLSAFEDRSLNERNQCKIVFGHLVTDNTINLLSSRVPIYFTFLRSPASFYVSFYNFYMGVLSAKKGKKPYTNFEDYYKECGVNRISRFICSHFPSFCSQIEPDDLYEKTMAVLSRFDYVFLTENMDKQLIPLLSTWNVPTYMERENISGKKFQKHLALSPQLEDRLNRENDVDFRIYTEYCKRWNKIS